MSDLIKRLRALARIVPPEDVPTVHEAVAALERREYVTEHVEPNIFIPPGYTLTDDGTVVDEQDDPAGRRPLTGKETAQLFRFR